MSATSNDEYWLKLVTQCRASGLTDRQWYIENGIPGSTFYYHVRALRKKACDVPEAADAAAQKEIHEHAGVDVIRNTLLALRQLC